MGWDELGMHDTGQSTEAGEASGVLYRDTSSYMQMYQSTNSRGNSNTRGYDIP